MTFAIYSQKENRWVDLTPYIAFQGFDGSINSVDGPNAGRVIEKAKMKRDWLADKYKFNITTTPIPNDIARMIESLVRPVFFKVRTDYFDDPAEDYDVYSNNITKAYVIYKGYDMVKLSFPIVQQ